MVFVIINLYLKIIKLIVAEILCRITLRFASERVLY